MVPESQQPPEPLDDRAAVGTKRSDLRSIRISALLASVGYLLLALLVAEDYGPTWDCASGDYAYGEAIWSAIGDGADPVEVYEHGGEGSSRVPHPRFDARFRWSQLFPFAATLSAASCDLFWTKLGWLEPIAAHHLPIAICVAVLLYAVVLFVGSREGRLAGLFAAGAIVLAPRFFAHAQNNLKDVPEACLYALCALAFYRASGKRGVSNWLTVGVLAALALTQKQNALFLPVQFAITACALWLAMPSERAWRARAFFPGVGVGLVAFAMAFVVATPPLWFGIGRVEDVFRQFFVVSGVGRGAVSWDAPALILTTTPIPLLALAVVGMLVPARDRRLKVFLVCWLGVVVGRLLIPGMRNFDGVRHFLEFVPPLAMLASLGLIALVRLAAPRLERRTLNIGRIALAVLALAPGAASTVRTHPNGIVYFNSLIGGASGARASGMHDVTDYWGNAYWQGIDWLADEAPEGTKLIVPVAPQVVRAAAHRLREDLVLCDEDDPIEAPLAVMYVTRETRYGPLIEHLRATRVPTSTIVVQGVAILEIHLITDPIEVELAAQHRQRESRADRAVERIVGWAQSQPVSRLPEVLAIARALPVRGMEASLAELEALLPPALQADAELALWRWAEATD